jgi:hypothetical protein
MVKVLHQAKANSSHPVLEVLEVPEVLVELEWIKVEHNNSILNTLR